MIRHIWHRVNRPLFGPSPLCLSMTTIVVQLKKKRASWSPSINRSHTNHYHPTRHHNQPNHRISRPTSTSANSPPSSSCASTPRRLRYSLTRRPDTPHPAIKRLINAQSAAAVLAAASRSSSKRLLQWYILIFDQFFNKLQVKIIFCISFARYLCHVFVLIVYLRLIRLQYQHDQSDCLNCLHHQIQG